MHADVRFTLLGSFLALLSPAQAFYVPGFSIRSYSDGEDIPLLVNKVYSDFTQLQYAFSELPFVCQPDGLKRRGRLFSGASISLNLGEVLRGDRIVVSDYELAMGRDQEARYLCSKEVDAAGLDKAREIIRDGYVAEWIVDNLPGATSFVTTDNSRKYYASGFKMGWMEYPSDASQPPVYYINNHVTLVIRYHRAPGRDGNNGKKVIVGFEVFAKSIAAEGRNETGLPQDVNDPDNPMAITLPDATDGDETDEEATLSIPYTYSVYFRENKALEWANRWDMYFVHQEDNRKVHWLAIINSLVICALLTAVVAVIFTRTIRGDLSSYKDSGMEEGKPRPRRSRPLKSPPKSLNEGGGAGGLLEAPEADLDADFSDEEESLDETTGWKLLHGDVFRPPAFGGLLAALVGSGTQLVFMAMGLLVLGCLGVLNPSFRGGYISTGMGLFILAGAFSGYFSARVYRTFGGQHWRQNVVFTGTLIPGLLFTTIFILNLFVWAQASSTAIPFSTLIALLALWLLIQLPLVYVGSWLGYVRVGAYEHPTKTTAVPRQLPTAAASASSASQQVAWHVVSPRSVQTILGAGLIPFAVVFIELLFVFRSLWQDKSGYYYVFGFMAVVSVILMVTVVEVTIVATYVFLCSENYHWWWHSFAVGGSSAVWVFAYCAWYFFTKLHIQGFVSSMLFFSYSFLACAVYGLLTGTIGFLAAYAFVRRIYGAIKVD